MAEKAKAPPHHSPAGKRAAATREARLAAALRANLQRRKARTRERLEPAPGETRKS